MKILDLGRTRAVATRATAAPAENTTVKSADIAPPAEEPEKDAVTIFDCWQREWIPNTATSFLTKGAAIVKIKGSEVFEHANITFRIIYDDDETETFLIPFSYDGKRTKTVKERDRITGTVAWFNPVKGYGFIRPSSGERDVFVHISAVMDAGLDTLDEGDTVEYELVTAYDGRTSADNLKV
jgi:CspA family cold shock protein